jgi:mannosyltransferase OCH1-like enzyme
MEKIIHRLWLGPKEMPERYESYGRLWKELNPGWEVIDWGREALEQSYNHDVLEEISRTPKSSITMESLRASAVQQADVLGYEILYRHGGAYFNCDIEPLRPMDELLSVTGERPWASHEDDYHIVNAAFGGAKEDPFWKYVVDGIHHSYFSRPAEPMEVTTGPRYLTERWKSYFAYPEDFVDLPIGAFNFANFRQIAPGGNADEFREAAIAQGAYGLHHWGHREDQINY